MYALLLVGSRPYRLQIRIEFLSQREHTPSSLERRNGYLDECAVRFVEFYYICPANAQCLLSINRCG